MKNVLIPSLYILEKNLLGNKYKKQICYRKIKSPFSKFFIQNFVIFNMITDCFLVKKWRTLEVGRRLDDKKFRLSE